MAVLPKHTAAERLASALPLGTESLCLAHRFGGYVGPLLGGPRLIAGFRILIEPS